MKALVITIPGLRPDYLGCYGSDWVDTPAFDELAADGIVFDQHHAGQPDGPGACRAWRSGRYSLPTPPSQDRALAGKPRDGSDLLALLRAAGVSTCLVADGKRPPDALFLRDWGQIHWAGKPGKGASPLDPLLNTAQDALARLLDVETCLLWVDLPALLPPWNIPKEYLEAYFQAETNEEGDEDEEDEEDSEEELNGEKQHEKKVEDEEALTLLENPTAGIYTDLDETELLRLQHTYAAAVSYVDAATKVVLQHLDEVDPDENWLLLVTSSHGLSLGEHGLIDPARPWLHEERLHLPMIIRLPGSKEGGRRSFALTQDVDLAATLLDAFGLKANNMDGRSLLPLCHGNQEPIHLKAVAGWQLGEALEYALITLDWKLILPVQETQDDPPRQRQLYVRPEDPREINNVGQHHLEWADELEQQLREFVKSL